MDLRTLTNNIARLKINNLLKKIFNESHVKDFVVERNQEQLYYRGIDATGKVLKTYSALGGNVYSNLTLMIKQEKGQPTNVVTLKDTGAFYKTFKEVGMQDYAEITANFEVHGESIAENIDITNVLGLTQDNKELLIEYIKPFFIKEFKTEVLK